MIQANNLSKAYGQQILFDNISFNVNSGEKIGLVGRNGHGKTTLFRIITGHEKPDSGTLSIPNGYAIGHLSQHIDFRETSVLKEACQSLPLTDDGRDETYRAKAILMGLGFSENDFSKSPHELSGGYQIRLNLAKLLLSEPDMLLLDEPTNYLDITSIRWLTQFLKSWKGELMLITHDRDFMDNVTTHTIGIHRQKIKKVEGSTHKLYSQILAEEEVYEKTRVNDEKKRKETELFINRFRAQATKAKAVQSRIKSLQKKERLERLADDKNLDFKFKSEPFSGRYLLEAQNISFSFSPEIPPVIENFRVIVSPKDRIAVIGPNGKGKTTLLNLLSGELTPTNGMVIRHPTLKYGYFGQTNVQRLNPQKTVEDEILDAMPEYNRKAARNICGIMMFEGDNALKKISVLSGGEKSRVLMGKLLTMPANLLLLDEPTNHLDMESIDSLIEAVDAFDGAVIIVTHSEMILNAIAERLIVFDGGAIKLFEGSYNDFLDRVGWQNEDTSKDEQQKQSKNYNKKDLRRIRAEIISERSKIIGSLQKRIEEIESEIISLEESLEEDNLSLIEASTAGDGERIKVFSKSTSEAKIKIESLFDELSKLTEELDLKSREFEERLQVENVDNISA
jgi:ATP-binding cassette subfamily F protein 3